MNAQVDLRLEAPGEEVDRIEGFIGEKVRDAGLQRVVVGLSGGIDSSASALLAHRAMGPENVETLFMPEKTTPKVDSEDVGKLSDEFGLEIREIPIDRIVNQFVEFLPDPGSLTLANVKARVRMTLLYARANEIDGMVIGTGNLSEWLLGYFTKHGDGAADIAPIMHLFKTELRDLAGALDIPKTIIHKPPSAGLWDGQTDEEELGGSYEEIDKVLHCREDLGLGRSKAKEKLGLDESLIDHVYDLVDRTTHKRNLPPSLDRFQEE